MIDPTHLRKGNLVCIAHESNAPIATISEIHASGAVVSYDPLLSEEFCIFKFIMPIELNSHWMDRCGFKTPDGYHISVLYNEIMIDFHLGEYKLRDRPKTQLKYLHQLQNIFFWLAGEELVIN